jgi:hypothetical protein
MTGMVVSFSRKKILGSMNVQIKTRTLLKSRLQRLVSLLILGRMASFGKQVATQQPMIEGKLVVGSLRYNKGKGTAGTLINLALSVKHVTYWAKLMTICGWRIVSRTTASQLGTQPLINGEVLTL